ncbi:hypothetical protein EGR_03539 [Echinococcus granulosus]|uniref:Fibronectin type-III domain-containing protein n=1 Tax=Echinococcus granulosus TaxID=6210 RepID=W6UJM3_ECHGR|nr:hypothetical protein EGR_03539 [Echinococcus granulosus]EUB61725.1 hypothetical protein EGR_03539 [Echinococcus granulosus]
MLQVEANHKRWVKLREKKRFCIHNIEEALYIPNKINVTALNQTAVNVKWDSPSDRDQMDVFFAYTKGAEGKYCWRDKGGLTCTFEGLAPSTTYEFCVKCCHVHSSTPAYFPAPPSASLYSIDTSLFAFEDSIAPKSGLNFRAFYLRSFLVSNRNNFAPGQCLLISYCLSKTCSLIDNKNERISNLEFVPNKINVTALNQTAVNVKWDSPSDRDQMDVFFAYTKGAEGKYCWRDKGGLTCTFEGLAPSTTYEFCVKCCHVHSSTPAYFPAPPSASLYSIDTSLFAFEDSIAPKSGLNFRAFYLRSFLVSNRNNFAPGQCLLISYCLSKTCSLIDNKNERISNLEFAAEYQNIGEQSEMNAMERKLTLNVLIQSGIILVIP